MTLTLGLNVITTWHASANVPEHARRAVESLLSDIAPHLNECEAALFDFTERSSGTAAFLMPEITLNLPVYEARDAFTLHVRRVDATRMWLTRKGDATPLADVRLR